MATHNETERPKPVQRVRVVGIAHAPLSTDRRETSRPAPVADLAPEAEPVAKETASDLSEESGPTEIDRPEPPESLPPETAVGGQSEAEVEPPAVEPDEPATEEPGEPASEPDDEAAEAPAADAATDAAAPETADERAEEAPLGEPEREDDAGAGAADIDATEELTRGLKLHQRGDLAAAEAIYRAVLERDDENPDAAHLLGLTLHQTARHEEAETHLRRAIELRPQSADFLNSLGAVLIARERPDEARETFEAALALRDDLADAHYNIGYLDHAAGDLIAAAERYRLTLEHGPDHVAAMINWGSILMDSDRPDEAGLLFQRARAADPSSQAARISLARACLAGRDLDGAEKLFGEAIETVPDDIDAQLGLAETKLLAGDYEAGFELYEWRLRRPTTRQPESDVPEWTGQDLEGSDILVQADTGDADALQFVRFASMLATKGARVQIGCEDRLRRILETVPGIHVSDMSPEAGPKPTLRTSLVRLPRLLGVGSDAISAGAPYFSVPDGLAPPFRTDPEARMRIGLIWRGRGGPGRRDYPLERLQDIGRMPGLEVFSLQADPSREERRLLKTARIRDVGERIGDYADMATAIAELDLIVTVDAPAAHLAGGMARPVWLLLPHACGWQWGLSGETTSWYPTIRIFRQDQPGDWTNVARRIPVALAVEAAGKAGG